MSEARRSAFIVANDEYADQRLRRLRAPAADARELAGVLQDADIGGFDVALSINEPEHVVRRRLSEFFENRGIDDLLLLHLSCHGVKDEDAGSTSRHRTPRWTTWRRRRSRRSSSTAR